MAEKNRSLVRRLQYWLFGKRKANRADQKEQRDKLTTFLKEHEEEEHEEEKESAADAQEKRA